jgi:hypothetical protein
MRCYCCNNLLTTQEATRKFKQSGEYADTCNQCLKTMDVDVTEGNLGNEESDGEEYE